MTTQRATQRKRGNTATQKTQTQAEQTIETQDRAPEKMPEQQTEPIETAKTTTPTETPHTVPTDRTPRARGRRRHTGGGNKLVASAPVRRWAEENGLELRWVNDPTGSRERLTDMEEADWSLVRAPKAGGGEPGVINADEAGPDSTLISRVVNRSTGMRAYLMCMPKEWYDEYQQDKQKKLDLAEKASRRGADINSATKQTPSDGGAYGEIEISR